jgi:hypothetical protein
MSGWWLVARLITNHKPLATSHSRQGITPPVTFATQNPELISLA